MSSSSLNTSSLPPKHPTSSSLFTSFIKRFIHAWRSSSSSSTSLLSTNSMETPPSLNSQSSSTSSSTSISSHGGEGLLSHRIISSSNASSHRSTRSTSFSSPFAFTLETPSFSNVKETDSLEEDATTDVTDTFLFSSSPSSSSFVDSTPLLSKTHPLSSLSDSMSTPNDLGSDSNSNSLSSFPSTSSISSMTMNLVKPKAFATAFWTSLKLPLYSFDQVPSFLQDNEYILTGYRMHYTYLQSWASMFFVHNESGNIWTHLIAFVLFMGLAFTVPSLLNSITEPEFGDTLIFLVFLLSACHCFAFSVLFHTHYCNNRQAYRQFGCLDYAGISLLICGSSVLVTYYTLYCHFWLRWSYLTLLIGIAFVGIIGPMFPSWSTPHFRVGRTLVYVISGIVSGVPVLHSLILYGGIPEQLSFWGGYGFLMMGLTYLVGATIYAFKVPERWWPGALDMIGHSHQLWHVCVVLAALFHFISGLELMRWRVQTTC